MGGCCDTPRYRGGDGSAAVDIDTVLRVLADPLCRHVLGELAAQPSNYLSYDELVDSYVDSRPEAIDPGTVEVECHHSHFPALAEARLIEFDRESGDVRYHPSPFVEAVLDVVHRWDE